MVQIQQIQPRKHVLDHADYTAPTRQHELRHADHKSISPEKNLKVQYRYKVGICDVSDVRVHRC